ncbi:hypothetical protein FQN54_009952 [Arachnomyces sp. PD_36]|nr:hypothetical protein FQN54_009952 [Arachnomyces sp. PD_36]
MNFVSFFSRWFNAPRPALDPKDPQVIESIYNAIVRDDDSAVKTLLGQGAPMKEHHFLEATRRGAVDILQSYLDNGWDINTPMDTHNPPALAFAFENEKLVDWFLDHGADPNERCSFQDCTSLSIAVRDASIAIIKLLFERGGSIERGQLLHYAAQRKGDDRVEVLQFIFAKNPTFIGKTVNKIKDEDNPEDYCRNLFSGLGTPLHYAAREGFLDVVQFLLQNGADTQRQDPQGKIALDWAEYYGHEPVVEELKNPKVVV